jgi:O-glycosyl hydrolase
MKSINQYWVLNAVLFAAQVSFGQTNDSVSINMAEEYQQINEFGGANIPDWIDDMNADQVDKAFGNAPGQIGL